jgi:hypothetical protein
VQATVQAHPGANAPGAAYKGPQGVTLRLGTPYRASAPHTQATWAAVQAAVAAAGGAATAGQLAAVCPQHLSFIGYAVRRGWLVAVAN